MKSKIYWKLTHLSDSIPNWMRPPVDWLRYEVFFPTDEFEKYIDPICLFQKVKYLIRRDYGANCKTSDIEELGYEAVKDNRCDSCRAKETINFIDEHIKLLNEK